MYAPSFMLAWYKYSRGSRVTGDGDNWVTPQNVSCKYRGYNMMASRTDLGSMLQNRHGARVSWQAVDSNVAESALSHKLPGLAESKAVV